MQEMQRWGSIPGLGRSPGGENSNPLQHPCLEIPRTEEPGGLQQADLKLPEKSENDIFQNEQSSNMPKSLPQSTLLMRQAEEMAKNN